MSTLPWAVVPLFLAACGREVPLATTTTPTEGFAGSARLDSSAPVFWTGTVRALEVPAEQVPIECQDTSCDHFVLEVDLPEDTFADPNLPGGVQIALRWFGDPEAFVLTEDSPGCCGERDTLHLFVYRDDVLVGASAGIIATAQSVLLAAPPNGTYDVWVAWDPTYNQSPSVDYEGLAEVEIGPALTPAVPLLPDLTFRTSDRIGFLTPSFPYFEPEPVAGATCFASEVAEGAENCLRFDQTIANDGPGDLQIAFAVPSGATPAPGETFPTEQHVLYSDGSFVAQPAGEVELHDVHGHYHYSSFADSALWASDATGARLGVAPVVEARKVSFCMADIRIDAWGVKGDGPRQYFAPDCLLPATSDGVTDQYVQGITRGWADIYDWYISDQYIEVTGVPDGHYLLEMCADPDDAIEELDETNNCLGHHLFIAGVGTPTATVERLAVLAE
jgi:Lysyl oxidase